MRVKHTELTVGKLHEAIANQSFPVKRSTHVGNQPPHELVLQCLMPPGILNIAVDSIQAGDNYSNPRVIRLAEADLPIAKKRISSVIVGAAVAREDIDEHLSSGPELMVVPRAGESLANFHMRSLVELNPNNMPVLMSEYFARDSDAYMAVMKASKAGSELMRVADYDGSIRLTDLSASEVGIFGLADASPINQGLLPSLEGMMALDMLDSIKAGANKTMHLAGPDMIRYTRDSERMSEVASIMGKASAELGIDLPHHCYEVVDINGLSRLVPLADYASQHELLRAQFDPASALGRICTGRLA